jgi:hypothetical protein
MSALSNQSFIFLQINPKLTFDWKVKTPRAKHQQKKVNFTSNPRTAEAA